jgi:hypothetical protein
MRYLALALVVCTIVVVGAVAVGRAMDAAIQDRIVFTRGGVTFDCERRFFQEGEPITYEDGSSVLARAGGEVAYGNCHTVP